VVARIARKALPVLAFLIPLFVYLLTLAPGLTWAHYGADGGDLVTAAYTLGVPHPPGYPTYTVLARLFTHLPLGDVAWRVNLLSSVSTAAAAALIYWIVAHLGAEAEDTSAVIAGLGAAWSYAFAPLVWSQALITEVYALVGFWTVLILWLTLPPPRSRGGHNCTVRRRKWRGSTSAAFTLGLVWSVGLGIHPTLISLAPVIIWTVIRHPSSVTPVPPSGARRSGIRHSPFAIRHSPFATLGFLTGLLIWLYLPLRAGRGGVTWGQPTTLEGFWWLVSGALYRDYLFALPASALGGRLAAWAQTWGRGLGLTGVGLAALGVTWLAGRQRSFGLRPSSKGWLAATGLSFVILNLYALGYNTTDSVVYLVPAFAIASIWLGAGLTDLFGRMGEWDKAGRWLTPLTLTIALVTPAWTLARNGGALDLSDDHCVKSFCRAVMKDAPPRAILLTTTDRQTFALWYCQQVEGLRPDVAVVDEGLAGFDWYRAGLQRPHPDLWISQADASAPIALTDERPHCRVRREAQTGWLDCQDSKSD
jgi:hypothetical protein